MRAKAGDMKVGLASKSSTRDDEEYYQRRWLDYARRVVGDGQPRSCCVCDAGDSREPHLRLLWPGYVGADYSNGRVLFVGAVHNEGELFTPPIVELARVAERWATSPRSKDGDAQYLLESRKAYIASATQRISPSGKSWTQGAVWGAFDTLRRDLKLSWDEVAYTNAAKCATASGVGYDARIRCCEGALSSRLPIAEVAPLAVFINCGHERIVAEARDCVGEVQILRVFKQRGMGSVFPTAGVRWDSWRLQDVGAYQELRMAKTRTRPSRH